MGIEAAIIVSALSAGYQMYAAEDAKGKADFQRKKQEEKQFALEAEAKEQQKTKQAVDESLKQSAQIRSSVKNNQGYGSTILTGPAAVPSLGASGGTKTLLGS